MKAACYIKKESLRTSPEVLSLLDSFTSCGIEPYSVESSSDIIPDTGLIVSIGGDGTFLSASIIAAQMDIPLLGVNFGHLGFLAEAPFPNLAARMAEGRYTILERSMLEMVSAVPYGENPLALNEIVLHRRALSTIGIDICINGVPLPACWADGLIVSTSSGSTAYNLSAGGPICTPETDVLIITPIAPHNLGVRPLIVPGSSEVSVSAHGGELSAELSLDNRSWATAATDVVRIRKAGRSLKCVTFGRESFINALKNRLFWGADKRNSK